MRPGFFVNDRTPYKYHAQHDKFKRAHIDIQKPPEKYTQEQLLDRAIIAMNEAMSSFNKALNKANIVKTEPSDLPSAYRKRQAEEASGLLSYFKPASKEPVEIDFITSIAASLKVEAKASSIYLSDLMKHTPRALSGVKEETLRLNQLATSIVSIIDGAYIFVLQSTAASFKNAWIYKDPSADPLYLEMSQRVGKKSTEEKIACLTALQRYLQTEAAQKTIKFGNKKIADVLATIAEQIEELSPSTHIKPK